VPLFPVFAARGDRSNDKDIRPLPEIHVPENLELGRQIGTLIGRIAVVKESKGRNRFEKTCHSAYYVTREDALAGFCVVDLALSGYLGGALAMIPQGTVQEEIHYGELGEDLLDAYYEVANIMAALLCADGTPHVRLLGIDDAGMPFESPVLSTIKNPCRRIDVHVDVAEYGSGILTLLTTRME
jgi:hypothetical protein